MKIGIIGYGVVGGATGQVLGAYHEILPYDRYKPPYHEYQYLDRLVKEARVIFVCVPTPMKNSGEIDQSAIHHSLQTLESEMARRRRDPKTILVVIRSTAVSGTTDSLALKYKFRFAFNPEFLTEKNALEDMKRTSRVVIGANDAASRQTLAKLYRAVFPKARYIFVDRKTAEMIKYTANVMLAAQIAVANEIYQICRAIGVNYEKVKETILLDPRIGRNINVPGPDGDFGFGGKCFPKDLNALIYMAREAKYRPYLLEEVWRLNERVRTKKDW